MSLKPTILLILMFRSLLLAQAPVIQAPRDIRVLTWDYPYADRNQCVLRIYSTVNVTYSQAKIQERLTWIVRTWNTPAWSTNQQVRINIYDLIPVTADMLPTYKTWPLYATVPITNGTWSFKIDTKQRYYIATASNTVTHLESEYSPREPRN